MSLYLFKSGYVFSFHTCATRLMYSNVVTMVTEQRTCTISLRFVFGFLELHVDFPNNLTSTVILLIHAARGPDQFSLLCQNT